MTLVLIVLIVLLWGAVIVPTLLRARESPASSVGSFRKTLKALEERSERRRSSVTRSGIVSPGSWIIGPAPSSGFGGAGARRRGPREAAPVAGPSTDQRRQVFVGLLAAAALTLVAGFFPGLHILLMVHVGIDVLLVVYVGYLLRTKARRPRRELVTTYEDDYQDERLYLRVGEL